MSRRSPRTATGVIGGKVRSVKRHMRENYYVVGEGILTTGEDGGRTERPPASTAVA